MSLLSPPRTDRDAPSRHLAAFPAGARIYLEGEIGTEMYVVRSGQVEITRGAEAESRVVARGMPDVDLTPLDPRHSVSWRHARLYRIGATTYVMEEIGVLSGTFVNDARLATGVPSAIHHGDVLKLGQVALTFWNPSA